MKHVHFRLRKQFKYHTWINCCISFLESRLIFLVNCNQVISPVVILFCFFLFWCFDGKEIELLYSSPAFLSNIDARLVDWCSKRIIKH